MNKIYKVIWSKVRNCYVAVSEIAKRNGKSCTSVNYGAKANRRRVRVLLAIAAAFCVVPVNVLAANSGGHVNDAGNYVGDSPYIVVIDGGHDGAVDGKYGEDSAQNAQVTIKSGTVTGNVCGGWTYGTGINATGNIVKITGGTVNGYVCGSYAASGIATGIVEITDGEIKNVYGSRSQSGTAKESHVTVEKFTTSETGGIEIYGGYTSAYDPFSGNTDNGATDNIVTLKGSENGRIKRVYGGYVQGAGAGSAINNTVELDGYQYYGNSTNLYGGWVGGTGDSITGNKLLLSNVYNKVGWIYNFETIKLANSINWTPGGFVLSAFGYKNGDNGEPAMILDITDAFTNFKQATERGTMTLLNSVNLHQLSTIKLKYNSSAAEALPSTTNKKVVKAGTAKTSPAKGVTIGYNENEHVVSFESSDAYYNQYERICYTIADNATSVSFGNMAWGTGRELTDGQFSFNSDTTINASNLTFSNKATTALKTDGTSTMELLTNATGLTSSNAVTGGTNRTLDVEYTDDKNVKFNATAKGDVTATTNKVKYTVKSVATDKITLGEFAWSGTSDSMPTGWSTSNSTTVNASNLTFTGTITSNPIGTSKTLLSGLSSNAMGTITQPSSGKGKVTVSGVTDGSVTYDGKATGSVSVSSQSLIYTLNSVATDKLTLGSFAWGVSSNSLLSGWSTSGATTVDASNLTFTGTIYYSNPINTTKTLVSGLSSNTIGTITQPSSGKGEVTVSGYNDGNGVTFGGTGKGTVSLSSKNLIYTINNVEATNFTLGSFAWGASDTMPTDWTASASTQIDDTNFAYTTTANEKLIKNDTRVILNATGLTTASPVTLGVNANKTVGMNFTDNGTNGSGFNFVGTVNGHVATANDVANYMVDSVTLNSINLKSWTGNPYNIASTDGWVLSTNDQSVVNAVVNTSDFSLPSGMTLTTGEKKVIVTAEGTDYFKDIRITGTSNVWSEGGALSDTESDSGVSVTGTQTTGGVKVNELDKNQIIYESSKKNITTITLGTVPEFKYDGTAACTFDSEYDVSTASITTTAFKFADTSPMEAGDVMTIIDATSAISYATSGQTLKDFDSITYPNVAFEDTITDPTNSSTADNIKFAGKHTDTLSLNAASTGIKAKTKLLYTVGDKVVDTATLSGPIAWSDGGTYYTNGTAANQKGRNSVFTFDSNSKNDISGIQFSATTDPLNKTMTLISGNTISSVAKNVVGTIANGTPADFGVSLAKNNTTLKATATGSAAITSGNLTYTVSGVAIDKVDVTSITNDADTVPTGWKLAKDSSDNITATVETDGLVVASPSGLAPGETKVIIEGPAASTDYFNSVKVNGSHAWKVDGSDITADLNIGGVAITGTQTAGGVKVNEANTNQIIYEESKKSINTLTLGSVTFANDDGTAATVARTFDKTYDVSTATINADDLAFANSDIMETGNSMRIVDASAAIPNAISNMKLLAFTEQTKKVAFTDTITGKNLTLKGAHTDTLSQDAAQTTLTYTVGDKVVSSATLTGDITWSDGGVHYTNGSDANQNGTKATYTFDSNSAVDISGVQFNAAADPLAGATKTMTLLKDVNGVAVNKVSGVPAFAVTIDQTNTKLDAKAAGASGVSGNDVTFTVSGVTLDKITVKSANGTADKVPASWTMAAGATIETDSMTVPELAAGTHVDILQSDTDEFFAKVAINGANAYGNTQDAFTESDAAKSVTIAGTQDKGVTLNTEKKHLIYKAGTLDVASVTLGLAEWKKGATVFERSGAGYNYAGVAALGTDGFAISYASPETVATGDSMTLLQANATLKDMAEQVKKTSYSYTPVTGVTIDANITGKLATSGGAVTYTATENQASKLTFTNVDWKDSGALLTRPSNITFAGADVDTAKIHFQNVKELDANRKMTLVSDFGDSVGTITGSKYTVGAGLEGEGAASLSGSDLVFTTKTGARDLAAQEQTHNTLMVMEAGMAVLAAGREHLGQAMVGLADPQNAGSDGTRIGASMGGGWSRYKTGSHVDSNNWNVAAAVGSKRELKRGSLEWGVFGEYGKSNYTLHSDAGRGDGDSHYAGGGLMAKWTNKHDVYTEASVRLGRLSDTANNLLRDAAGNGYGYDVHANYFGAHVGIGKIIHYKGGKSLDVYGKYFYTKRDGVDFASGGNNYSLDSVASSILRVGARYGTTDKKWNWYGGLAYEYEFDGKSEGTVDGIGIRAASVKGGSVRGEIGLRMSATKTNPWQTDISIYGYGGKHRGFGGSVNVAYMF